MIRISFVCISRNIFQIMKIIKNQKPNFKYCSKILELEEELKVVGNNMKSLEVSEQEVLF